MNKIDYLQVLHCGNPMALKEIVGFFVETYYEKSGNYIFWEKPKGDETIFDTNIKKINIDKCQKACYEKMQEIRRELFED